MIKIRFIANPFSGVNRKRNLAKLLDEHLNTKIYDYELVYTEHAGHAVQLSKEAVRQGFDMVVACGGDGSINEISGPLIGTCTVLGILPCGSGNGFATHLGIGRNIVKAIQHLNDGQPITIDTCRMNGCSYVNLAGVGFDAAVANRLHGSKMRGLWAYFRFTVEEVFKYKMLPLEISIDGKTYQRSCLLAEVANAPIYGYGFSIVPPAKFNDGKLEILLVNKAPKWRYLFSLWRLLNGTFHKSRLAESFTASEVFIRPARACAAHVDGEGFELQGEAIFSILPASLKVLCPKFYVEKLR